MPSIDASCDAWPVPRDPTPIIAIRTLSIFGAAKPPMYFAPGRRAGACAPANAGSAAIAAVAPPTVLRKCLRSVRVGFLVFMASLPAREWPGYLRNAAR